MATQLPRLVCLFDCDNTLLDNDTLKIDLDRRLRATMGDTITARFWALYESERHDTGTVDIPMSVARLRDEDGAAIADKVWALIWNYPFPEQLYPPSMDVIRHVKALGGAVGIVSDGDTLYQPHKIAASGLTAAVDGHVKIYAHKQQHLAEILTWLPAQHYVMVDDKPQILTEIKALYPQQFTTVQVHQGHYAAEQAQTPPDINLAGIGDFLRLGLEQLAPGM